MKYALLLLSLIVTSRVSAQDFTIPEGKYANLKYREEDMYIHVMDEKNNSLKNGFERVPIIDEFVTSKVGRVVFTFYKDKWDMHMFNSKIDGIDKVKTTDYVKVWGRPMVAGWMAGLKKEADGSHTLEVLSAFDGKPQFTFKKAHAEQAIVVMDEMFAVQLADETYRVFVMKERVGEYQSYGKYAKELELLPDNYRFASKVKYVNFAVKDSGEMHLFHEGNFMKLPSEKPAPVQRWTKWFWDRPDKNFKELVLLRDGKETSPEFAALDREKVRKVLDMRYTKGTPVGWAWKNTKAKPVSYHLLRFANDQRGGGGNKMYELPGTIFIEQKGFLDVRGMSTLDVVRFTFQDAALARCKEGWGAFILVASEDADAGAHASECGKLASDQLAYENYVKSSPIASMSPEEIEKNRLAYIARQEAMIRAAEDNYQAQLRQDEYRKKMREWEADQAFRRDMSAAFQSMTSSIVRGATSNTPQGPRGFEDKYDNTGAGYNRYDKEMKKRAEKKAACRGAGCP